LGGKVYKRGLGKLILTLLGNFLKGLGNGRNGGLFLVATRNFWGSPKFRSILLKWSLLVVTLFKERIGGHSYNGGWLGGWLNHRWWGVDKGF